ncbi:MAG: hypothetical protein FVQ80_06970 [Planctomycetes bacterium]|nr:hypothetical protein [Planctomycetota bacterium]
MAIKVKLIHQIRDVTDSWDGNMFKDVVEAGIDEPSHTIQNVCVFGSRHSKNGYTYQDTAIDSLTNFTSGAKFFINHPSKSESKDRDGVRNMKDWAGVFTNAHREGEKVFADLGVRPVFWELVKDVATMRPQGVGNSINSRVKVFKDENGKEHVVDIEALKSIDLVASAATTQNLFESAIENANSERDDFVESLSEGEEKAFIFHNLSVLSEGLLAEKIKEKEVMRAISNLNWMAADVIEEILKDKKKNFKDKKSDISSILDDLESQIGKIMSGKKKSSNDSNSPELLFHKTEQEDDMDFTKLTLEDILKQRPDILDAAKAKYEDAARIAGIEESNDKLTKANEGLVSNNTDLTKKVEELTKKVESLSKDLDAFQTKDKANKKEAFISEKIKESKLPDEAISDVFKADLMLKAEAEIEVALADRKGLWTASSGKVVNSGEEFVPEGGEPKTVTKEKKESAVEKFKSTLK